MKGKIAFFYRPGCDKFLNDIISEIEKKYDVKRVEVTKNFQIEEVMEWADICWFEWCDQLMVYSSNLELAKRKKIICRLHRYEVFTKFPTQVNWENVDNLILVTGHLKKLMEIDNLEERVKINIIENGVDVEKYPYKKRKKGYNLAFIADIIMRKNPMMLLQIIKSLTLLDTRYKLYLAGQFNDRLTEEYFKYICKEMNLENNVFFEGWQNNINNWLENKNYILSTSIHESFGYNIAEAMVKGIKPVVHNFLYAKEIWPEEYIFNTLDEAIEMITSDTYNSEEYRNFITTNFSLDKEIMQIDNLLDELLNKKKTSALTSLKVIEPENIVIFGASTLGKMAYEILSVNNNICYFCDNDSKKWGKTLYNIKIVSPDFLLEKNPQYKIIVASQYSKDIIKQLLKMGFSNIQIFQTNIFPI